MIDGRVRFFYVVTLIIKAWHLKMAALELRDLITEPMETHVHGICPLGGNGVIYNAECCCVIRLYGGWGLRVAHFNEFVVGGDCRAAVDEEGANFGFGGG